MAFMLPTDDASRPALDRRTARAATSPGAPAPTAAAKSHRRPLKPIGPDKLRRLRESILNGTYPLDEAVIGGLARMFMGPAPRRCREDDA